MIPTISRRDALAGAAAAACCIMGGTPARAQSSYPSRPVRIVAPFTTGGGADILARILAEHLRTETGQPFIVENKPGAQGLIALEDVGRAKPDGHTLMLGNITSNTITPLLYRSKLRIDYERDIAPVARLAEYPAFLLATKGFEPQTFQDFVAYARQNPGKVRFGMPGVGSYPHFDMVLLARAAKVDLNYIPNSGGGAAVLKDLVIGDAQIGIVNVVSAASQVRSGNVRPLALIYNRRLPDYPDVPTLAELGYPGVGTISRLTLFATGGTPPDILEKLSSMVVKALNADSVAATLKKIGMISNPTPSAAAAKTWIAEEMAAWRKIIAEANIDVEGKK